MAERSDVGPKHSREPTSRVGRVEAVGVDEMLWEALGLFALVRFVRRGYPSEHAG